MNYMLIENNTLSTMKKEHFEYVKSIHDDESPQLEKKCHVKNITCLIILKPDDLTDPPKHGREKMSAAEYRKNVKFASGAADGTVKIWAGMNLTWEMTIKVATDNIPVTAITFMTLSKKLVIATMNRMISFYEINSSNRQNIVPYSRLENLVAVPLCLEYYRWPQTSETNKNAQQDKKETILVGDDLGIIHMYNFEKEWHHCQFKNYGYDRVEQ